MSSDIKTSATCKNWGYSFKRTDSHLSKDQRDALREQHDNLGSDALAKLQAFAALTKTEYVKGGPPFKKPDMYAILRDHHEEDDVLKQFWDELHFVPEWVDWKQIERGQKFFARHAVANITVFALQRFVRDNAAAPGVAEVFARTGGFVMKNMLSRFIETFTWLIQVTNDLDSIKPGGEGHTSTIRVRLLHASVRQGILKLVQTRPEYVPVEVHGAPVNDLDLIHAISLFCCSPMWDSFPKMGIYPSKEEIDDFIALFRYIAYLTGTPSDCFVTQEKAKAIMETVLLYELAPSGTSKILAPSFIHWISDKPPLYLSRDFLEAGCHWMNGRDMCDALGLGKPSLYYTAVFAGHNVIVSNLAFVQKWHFRKALYNAITDNAGLEGGNGRFDFKFIPDPERLFDKEVDLLENRADVKKLPRTVEHVFLGAFIFANIIKFLVHFGLLCGWSKLLMHLSGPWPWTCTYTYYPPFHALISE